MRVETTGMDTIVGVMRSSPKRMTEAAATHLTDWVYEVFAESQKQVPVRLGVLKASGHVEEAAVDETSIQLSIGYGGAAAQYALWVHENLGAQHKPPTKAKYLEDPINEKMPKLRDSLRSSMESAILGQSPQSPSRGASREMQQDQRTARVKKAVAHSRGMSASEVTAALRSIDSERRSGGSRQWHRAKGKG